MSVVGLAYYFHERTEEAEETWLEYTSTGHFVLLYNDSSTRTAITNTIITGVSTLALPASRIIRTAFICVAYVARYDQYIRSRSKKWAIYARWNLQSDILLRYYPWFLVIHSVVGGRATLLAYPMMWIHTYVVVSWPLLQAWKQSHLCVRSWAGSDDRVTCTKPTHISAWHKYTRKGHFRAVLSWTTADYYSTTGGISVTATKVGKPEAVTFCNPKLHLR